MKYLLIIFAVILFSSCAKECNYYPQSRTLTHVDGCSKKFISKRALCNFLCKNRNFTCEDLK